MTTSDVDRLYSGLTEVASEVRTYRAELNGRLRRLEEAEAHRNGRDHSKGSIGRIIMGVAAVSAAVGSIVGVTFAVIQGVT
jgi:epoxyqueuosine reductase QueG